MLIDFNHIEEIVNPRFKGGEKEARFKSHADENNKIMMGRLVPGASIGMHIHQSNSEIIYILEGTGRVLFDEDSEALAPGSCHYCPKGHGHSLINDGGEDLVFFAVVPEHE